jgi:hypothetical protein
MSGSRLNDNPFLLSTVTTKFTTAFPFIPASGIAQGVSQASQLTQAATSVFLERSGERQSLLDAINKLFDNNMPDGSSVKAQFDLSLNSFLAEINQELGLVQGKDLSASLIARLLTAPASAASHFSQLILDISAAIVGVSHSMKDVNLQLNSADASTLQNDDAKDDMSSANVGHSINESAQMFVNVRKYFNEHEGSHGASALGVATMLQTGPITVGLIPTLLFDFIGSLSREAHGLSRLTKADSKDEKQIDSATLNTILSVSQSQNSGVSLEQLRALEQALTDSENAKKLAKNHSVYSPSLSVLARFMACSIFVEALRAANVSSLAAEKATSAVVKNQELSNSTAISLQQGSSLNGLFGVQNGANHPSANVTKLQVICGQINNLLLQESSADGVRADVAFIAGSASASLSVSSAVVMLPVLLEDAIGLLSREMSGLSVFQAQESRSEQKEPDNNIYTAMKNVSKSRNSQASLVQLRALEDAISNSQQAKQISNEQSVTAPILSVASRSMTSIAAVESLRATNIAYLAFDKAVRALNNPALIKYSRESVPQASSINGFLGVNEGADHPSANVLQFTAVCSQMGELLEKEYSANDVRRDDSMIACSADASLSVSSVLSMVPVLMKGALGSLSRESSALSLFLARESKSEQKEPADNVYVATTATFNSSQRPSNSEVSFQLLLGLQKAMSNDGNAEQMVEAHSVLAPITSVIARALSLSIITAALRCFNSNSIAMGKVSDALIAQQYDFLASIASSLSNASSVNGLLGIQGYAIADHHSANVTLLTDQMRDVSLALAVAIPEENKAPVLSSAMITSGVTAVLSMIPVLIMDAAGAVIRETIGSVDFAGRSLKSQASSHLSKILSGNYEPIADAKEGERDVDDKRGAQLDALMKEVSNLKAHCERATQFGIAAPAVLGATHVATMGGMIAMLNSVSGLYSALRELTYTMESHVSPSQLRSENLALDEAEQKKVAESKDRTIANHQYSAANSGTRSVSDNMPSAPERALQSALEKIILIQRNLDYYQPGLDRQDLNSTAKLSIGAVEGLSGGFMSATLGGLAFIAAEMGISTSAFLNALRLAFQRCDQASDGLDHFRVPGVNTKSNLSVLCNVLRLCGEADGAATMKGGSSFTAVASEVTLSRSLFVALCNAGVMTAAIREVIQSDINNSVNSDSTLLAANAMGRLEDAILRQLQAVGRNAIPGLEAAMASQLANVSRSMIASALSTHSVAIASVVQSLVASHIATLHLSDGGLLHEAETGSQISRLTSQFSNGLQIFTHQFVNFMGENVREDLKQDQPTLVTHEILGKATACTSFVTGAVSLFIEEMLEMVSLRSLTLLDPQKVQNQSQMSHAASAAKAQQSGQRTAEDSQMGQPASATQSLSALRFVTSRLGESLMEIADKLEKDTAGLLRDHLELHSSQVSSLQSSGVIIRSLATQFSRLSGVLSLSPIVLAGSVNATRKNTHSVDPSLQLGRVGTSAHSTKHSMDSNYISCVSTGIVSDLSTDVVTNLIKIMSKGLLTVTDGMLSLAKVIEIFSLHLQPSAELAAEARAACAPNASLAGASQKSKWVSALASVATTVGSAPSIISFQGLDEACGTQTTHGMLQSLQANIDRRLEELSMLRDNGADEAKEDEIGLKRFYQVMIALMENIANENDPQVVDFVNRLNFGGVALSKLHSNFGGSLVDMLAVRNHAEEKANNNEPILTKYAPLDVTGVFNKFVDAVVRDYKIHLADAARIPQESTLLMRLKTKLQSVRMVSPAVNSMWSLMGKIVNLQMTDYCNGPKLLLAHSQRRNVRPHHPEQFIEQLSLEGVRRQAEHKM